MPTSANLSGSGKLSAEASRRLEKFRALVRHANTHAPYYQRIIAERNINLATCTPAEFPLLTKALLMANFDDIVTDRRITKQAIADFLTHSSEPGELFLNNYTVMHTSGTSGEVGYFLTDNADMRRGYGNLARIRRASRHSSGERSRRWPFRGLRRIRIAFYGATGGHYAGVTMVTKMQKSLARLVLNARSFEVNSPLPSIVQQLNEFKPDFMFGYTTALKMLGEQQRLGTLQINPMTIAATGETVTKEDARYLQKSFAGSTVLSLYACTEHMMIGISNSDHETMTLTNGNLIIEFHDDHSVVTNLFNYTMPLIRYRMSDILRPLSAPGVEPVVVANLVGRSEQMPIFLNTQGKPDFISPHTINEVFVKGVTRFQMLIKSDTSFRFPVCVDANLTADQRDEVRQGVEQRLHEILQQKELTNILFEVAIVEDIPLNPVTRKFQLIVDNRK